MKFKIRFLFSMAFMLCLICDSIAQQNFQYAGFQVTGKVTRKSTGEPLSGATVNVKGTNTVTTTNQTGNFSINVPSAGSILVVTYAGMLVQETTVRSAGEVNFSLDE